MEETQTNDSMLPLDAPRVIALTRGKHTFTFKTRRIALSDWLGYFHSIVNQTLQVDGRREQVFETETALLELVDKVLVDADGFEYSGDKFPTTAVPLQLRLALGSVLRDAAAKTSEDDSAILSEFLEVKLSAVWPTEGQPLLYSDLVHRFRHPSIDLLKKFNFESSRVKIRGTADSGVSIYPSRQAIAVKIYDELIESVDGYSVNGKPLEGIENIRREMDGVHKASAALQIFTDDNRIGVAEPADDEGDGEK